MENYHKENLVFHLGENVLFEVSRFVSDFDSRIFTDLVLHYSSIGEDEGNPRYYLHDCYPPQFINDELVYFITTLSIATGSVVIVIISCVVRSLRTESPKPTD